MKVLLTGGLGHIGSSLMRTLPRATEVTQLTVVDNMLTQRYSSLFNVKSDTHLNFHEMDARNPQIEPLVASHDVIIHLAAITDAANSFEKSEQVKENNLESTRVMANYCSLHDKKYVGISSTSVYGSQRSIVDETCTIDDLQPQSPYAETKLAEEKLLSEIRTTKNLDYTMLRFGTIFGVSPGMRFHTAVNKFCWQASFNTPLTVWRTAYTQKRPYLALNDACNAIALLIKENLFEGQIYNVLTANYTVEDICNVIRFYKPSIEINFVDSKIMNQLSYEVDQQKFIKEGFKPTGNIDAGIKETLELLAQK